jgi:hypothetical protein
VDVCLPFVPLQQLLQCWHASTSKCCSEPAASIQLLELRQGVLCDCPFPIIHPPQLFIMHYYDCPIARELAVCFKVEEALLQSSIKRLHSVLRSSRAVAPVSYDGEVLLWSHEKEMSSNGLVCVSGRAG